MNSLSEVDFFTRWKGEIERGKERMDSLWGRTNGIEKRNDALLLSLHSDIFIYIYFQILCMCYLSPYILRFPLTWIFFPPTLLLLFISSFQLSFGFLHSSLSKRIEMFGGKYFDRSLRRRRYKIFHWRERGREKWFFFLVCTEWNVRSKWRDYWKRGRRWNRNITRLSHVSLSKEKVREREGKNEEENKKRGRSSQEPLDTTRPIWDSVLTSFSLFLSFLL